MRYSIRNTTASQVREVGGAEVKETRVAIFATLTADQVDKLRKLGCLVEELSEVKTSDVRTSVVPPVPVAGQPTWSPGALIYAAGLDQVRALFQPPLYGEGFNVAVVGSGIRATHEMIGGRVAYQKNYTSDPHSDGYDHDTGVASIIITVCPKCNILDMKVLDSKGQGTEEEVVLAVDDLISMREAGMELSPHVINLSLGTPDTGSPSSPLRAICREAVSAGIFVFASAGNSGPGQGTVMSPACERYVGAVGSVDPLISDSRIVSFVISDFSSRGPTKEGLIKPDAVFFGRDILMASSASDTATVAKSGTSFSTPFASGGIVMAIEAVNIYGGKPVPSWWPSEVLFAKGPPWLTPEDILDSYVPLVSVKPGESGAGKDNAYGWGMCYGPLIVHRLSVQEVTTSSLIMPVMLMGMLGVMIKAMD